jgi:hypothetical protein
MKSFDGLNRRCVKRFGVRAKYVRGEAEYPVRGVFDADHEEVSLEGNLAIASRGLSFGIVADSLPFAPKKGDRLRIGGKTCKVSEARPDSEGMIVLILKEE